MAAMSKGSQADAPRFVRDLMSTDVLTIGLNESLVSADDVMRLGRVRHVLVVDDDGKLVGVVSQRDLFLGGLLRALGYGSHARQKAVESLHVKDAMVSEPRTTTPDAAIEQAADIMFENKIGCLPVLDAGKLVGILTESDFVRHYTTSG